MLVNIVACELLGEGTGLDSVLGCSVETIRVDVSELVLRMLDVVYTMVDEGTSDVVASVMYVVQGSKA